MTPVPERTDDGPRRPRSLADDLRGRSEEELVALLLARPDLARPAPADLTALAARAGTRASTQRALEGLDAGRLQLLEALLATGSPADVTQAARWLGAGSGPERQALDRALADLETAALVWRSGADLAVTRTVGDLLGPRPGGLWPGLATLLVAVPASVRTPQSLAAEVASVPAGARAVLERLAWGPGALAADERALASADVRALLDRRLLVPWGEDQLVLPREMALHLRGGRLLAEPALLPPAVPTTSRPGAVVDLAAGGAASELLAQVDELAHRWEAEPPRVLRAGGLSVRDLQGLARALDVTPERAAFVVEIAHAAGLLADDGALDPAWVPTSLLDEWATRPPQDRWATLAAAWLASTRAPHLVGQTRPGARSVTNALGPDVRWPVIRTVRADVLAALADAGPGTAVAPDGLVALLAWRRPLRRLADGVQVVAAVVREAEWLGVTGRGALAAAGRALLDHPDDPAASAAAMAPHLPAPVTEILLQADLTAVAPGRVEGELARLLRAAADVESRGGATVFRFGEASVRRALDGGLTPDELLDQLRAASATPVPQPLAYLVQDVARRHGRTRVGPASSYLRCDDPVTVDAMLASPALATLRLRRIAPTVLVSAASGDRVLAALRDHGFAPAAESEDGVVTVPRAAARRVPARSRGDGPTLTAVVDEEHARGVVAALRSGQVGTDQTRDGVPTEATDPAVVLALLRDAAEDRRPVQVSYVGADGEATPLLFTPRRVEAGRAYGTVGTSEVERVLSIHRVSSATPLQGHPRMARVGHGVTDRTPAVMVGRTDAPSHQGDS
ncbi:helicase-associated domain-containing protein [Arsenicicoccus dermatophilus]|uniref:helicase-associated domain-containing protein n=1 Tax=Arsenicicoccus dermatophilus TaxID=1076331 RepID=UPI003916DCD0